MLEYLITLIIFAQIMTENPFTDAYTTPHLEAHAAVEELSASRSESSDSKVKDDRGARKKAAADKRLRSRVRLFGNLLGTVIREQAGKNVFSSVERLRKGFIHVGIH